MTVKCFRNMALALTTLALLFSISSSAWADHHHDSDDFPTKTPIKHVVVIFQENISFDHYFATYPHAKNPQGEPAFHAKDDTPRVNNLLTSGLLHDNPNSAQPFRLDRSEAWTCSEDHGYASEQKAFDRGLMDKFPESTGENNGVKACARGYGAGLVMGYYDGNTVTALWNYAQHFAMSDNSYGTTFGPSSPGALNLIAGNTHNATVMSSSRDQASGNPAGDVSHDGSSVIGDAKPAFDDCAPLNNVYVQVSGSGKDADHDNIGALLNTKNITWGWFQGGFTPSSVDLGTGIATCATTSTGVLGLSPLGPGTVQDYVSHHEPFLYFSTTGNPHHLPPTSLSMIGKTDQAGHQYDLSAFWTALSKDELPAVSFLKAKAIGDGHPSNSDPLDEQVFLVDTINKLQQSEEWNEIAVIILYDDSDGWYDHQMDPVIHQSNSSGDDFLTDINHCGVYPPPNPVGILGQPPNGRCGFGPRQPLLVISPWAKENYVDHRITDQSSVIRFIEDNWGLDRLGGFSNDATAGSLLPMFDFDDKHEEARKLFLDPMQGTVTSEFGGHHDEHDHDHHGR